MAWEDRTPFYAIEKIYGFSEKMVIAIMRSQLNTKAFKNWRARMKGRKTKHISLRPDAVNRAYCSTQYKFKGSGK